MIRSICLLVIYIGGWSLSYSQIQNNISFFQNYGFAYNPAVAGSDDAFSFFILHKSYFNNLSSHPSVSGLSIHNPFKYGRFGIGVNVFRESAEPLSTLFANGNFAYKINFYQGRLSIGGRLGIAQRKENLSVLSAKDPDYLQSSFNLIQPELGLGILYKDKKGFAGLSASRGLGVYSNPDSRLLTQFNFTAGLMRKLSKKLSFAPAMQWRYINGFPVFGSIVSAFEYDNWMILGPCFNTNMDLGFVAGINIGYLTGSMDKSVFLIYSTEYSTEVNRRTLGSSHEILLIIKLGNIESIDKITRKKITVSPLYFD